MKVCGIVCEYNPFHNGHLHHITETKKQGIDAIVCIMSGNFVQRAEFSIMHKRARAETAIRYGADLVIELPLPWSIASAERFAYGAISILDSLGVVDYISFGAETDNISSLIDVAELLINDEFNETFFTEYKKGVSYAKARELAVKKTEPNLSGVLKTPNNILAIEYIKALKKLRSNINPVCIKRFGADHDGLKTTGSIASASYLRDLIRNKQDVSLFIPPIAYEIISREKACFSAPVFSEDADRTILVALKRLSSSDFRSYCDVSEGLEYRLENAISRSTSLQEAIMYAKTKRYTHSRIRRVFLNAFLGVDGQIAKETPPYARILGFNDRGRYIVKSAKKVTDIPIITKPSSINNESEKARNLFALERKSDDIYSLFMRNPEPQGGTITKSPIYIQNYSLNF